MQDSVPIIPAMEKEAMSDKANQASVFTLGLPSLWTGQLSAWVSAQGVLVPLSWCVGGALDLSLLTAVRPAR